MAGKSKVSKDIGGTAVIQRGGANPMPAMPISAQQQAFNDGSFGPAPQMDPNLTFLEIGRSGLRQFSGWVREEFLPELTGRQAAQKFREMSDNNAIVGGLMFSFIGSMRKVEWRVEPANDSGEAAEMADFVDSLRDDMSQTWEDTIAENLSMLTYGFAPHEIVYKRRDGKKPGKDPRTGDPLPASKYDDGMIGWRRLPLMGQDTILKWFFDRNGQTVGMTQQPWTGPIVNIPIEKMMLFRPASHKRNPEGRSILRTAYRSYVFIKRLEEQEAIMFERLGGFPIMKVPLALMSAAQAGDAEAVKAYEAFKRIVTNVRIDEQMGLIIPSDMYMNGTGQGSPMYSFEFAVPQAGRMTVNANESIGRYQTNMMTSVLADFMQLGHTSRGTQGLSGNKIDLFMQATEGFINSVAAVYNRYGLPRLWELNGLNEDLMPQLVPDLVQRQDLDVLSNFVLRMNQAGMPMFPDEELQSFLRDAAGMPDMTSPEAMQAFEDHQAAENALPQMGAPGQPGSGKTDLQKMMLASLARRIIKHGGPRFGVHTHVVKKRKRRVAA